MMTVKAGGPGACLMAAVCAGADDILDGAQSFTTIADAITGLRQVRPTFYGIPPHTRRLIYNSIRPVGHDGGGGQSSDSWAPVVLFFLVSEGVCDECSHA
jgi:hypothetical protein